MPSNRRVRQAPRRDRLGVAAVVFVICAAAPLTGIGLGAAADGGQTP